MNKAEQINSPNDDALISRNEMRKVIISHEGKPYEIKIPRSYVIITRKELQLFEEKITEDRKQWSSIIYKQEKEMLYISTVIARQEAALRRKQTLLIDLRRELSQVYNIYRFGLFRWTIRALMKRAILTEEEARKNSLSNDLRIAEEINQGIQEQEASSLTQKATSCKS